MPTSPSDPFPAVISYTNLLGPTTVGGGNVGVNILLLVIGVGLILLAAYSLVK